MIAVSPEYFEVAYLDRDELITESLAVFETYAMAELWRDQNAPKAAII